MAALASQETEPICPRGAGILRCHRRPTPAPTTLPDAMARHRPGGAPLRSRSKNICLVSSYLLDRRASRLSPRCRFFCELLQFARLGRVEPATQGLLRAIAHRTPCPAGSTHPSLAIAHRTPCPAGSTEMQTGLSPGGSSARSWASGPTPSHQTPPGNRIYVGSIGIYFPNGFLPRPLPARPGHRPGDRRGDPRSRTCGEPRGALRPLIRWRATRCRSRPGRG